MLRKAVFRIPYSTQSQLNSINKKITLFDIYKKYQDQVPISAITAHDFITGNFANSSNCEIVLIGDSLSMTLLGYKSTNQIKLEEFLTNAKAVSRAVTEKYLIADLPFGTYESDAKSGVQTAIRLFQECENLQSVKIEGGEEFIPLFSKLNDIGISVIGHCGLTPQRYNYFGGYKVQGKSIDGALNIYKTCLDLQNRGKVKMLVLEGIPQFLSKLITKNLSIPTIGIGAGKSCSGQILVIADLLGMHDGYYAKFVKKYNDFHSLAVGSINAYDKDVKSSNFPELEHSYTMKKQAAEELEYKIEQLNKQY